MKGIVAAGAVVIVFIVWILISFFLQGCASEPMTENERIAQAQILAQGLSNAGAIYAQGFTPSVQSVYPLYNPAYSPVFNPVPIQTSTIGSTIIP